MQNTQNSILAVQLYLRDLRLSATEREQVTGLVGNITVAIERDLMAAKQAETANNGTASSKLQAPKTVKRGNGDPDKDIATVDEDRAFAEATTRR